MRSLLLAAAATGLIVAFPVYAASPDTTAPAANINSGQTIKPGSENTTATTEQKNQSPEATAPSQSGSNSNQGSAKMQGTN
jgi:hypothetical protein